MWSHRTCNTWLELLEDPATMQPLYERAWRVFCDSRVLSRLAWFSGLTSARHRRQ